MYAKPFLIAILLTILPMPATSAAEQGSWTYQLLTGSELTDCPICGRLPVTVPMSGTFVLTTLESTPLLTRYEVSHVSFRGSGDEHHQYQIDGSGTYQVETHTGNPPVLSLNLTIENGFAKGTATYSNRVAAVEQAWPKITANLEPLSWETYPMYALQIVAGPMPQFASITPVVRTGSIQIQWKAHGAQLQLERAETVHGLFVPLISTREESFTDVDALVLRSQSFYRLRE